jgi:predicted lipid-binding transport protein (Tim44 family)
MATSSSGNRSGGIRRNQDGSLDGRQTSPNRGGRGQRGSNSRSGGSSRRASSSRGGQPNNDFFTSAEAEERHNEGSRRGGQNSHAYDGTARTSRGRGNTGGSSRGSSSRSSSRSSGGNQGNDQGGGNFEMVETILNGYNDETVDQLREYFKDEVRDELYDEVRTEVLDEIRGTLDDLEQSGGQDEEYDDQED